IFYKISVNECISLEAVFCFDSLKLSLDYTNSNIQSTAREISHFLSGGPLPRVRFCDSWTMEHSCAWDSTIPERWTTPARGFSHFLNGGLLLIVRLLDSRAMEPSHACDYAIPER